ncbi:MAG TPA: peptidylprolyl isomerase [Blastocatellia bacterium]|nr:peptidylprolyl isomerase [Blastocatellia bacterium]
MRAKRSKSGIVKILGLILVISSIGFGLGALNRASSGSKASALGGLEPRVIATADGREITAKIYNMYVRNGIEALGLSDQTSEGREKIELLKEGVIDELIDRTLIQAEAERRQLAIPAETFKAAYTRRVNEMGGEDNYRRYLAEHRLSDEEFQQVVRQELYGQLMKDELGREVTATPAEVLEFYENHRQNPNFANLMKEPERVRASHILVAARRSQVAAELKSRTSAGPAEIARLVIDEMTRRRARAERIHAKLKAGADFADLARQYSDDPGTQMRGGDLGLFTRDTHTAGFDEAAFALKPGQISSIVETDYGFHIIKVVERKAERTRSFDEVRASLEQQLLARKQAEHLSRWLEARRRQSNIVKTEN